MNKLLLHNAILVTMEPGQEKPFNGYLLVGANGKIKTIAAGTPPPGLKAESILDLDGKIVLPGFLSGHSHLWQSAFRGVAADKNLWGWIDGYINTYGPFHGDGDLYNFTLHGSLDYLRHGITTAYNWTQNSGQPQERYLEQFHAELASGQRFIFGYALDSTQSLAVNRSNLKRFLSLAAKYKGHPTFIRASLGGLGIIIGEKFAKWEGDLMREFKLDAQIHYLEEPAIQEEERQQFHILQDSGLLNSKLVMAHFIHPSDDILRATAKAKAKMIWNPLSNGRLASGLADIPHYHELGVQCGMGLDGQASADLSDPFENMRLGLYATRMKYQSAKIMQPRDVLALHTIETAKVLGVDKQLGSLKVGKQADLCVVDPKLMDTGPIFDVYATIVFVCSVANLDSVYVGGEKVVERGQLLKHDFDAISKELYSRVEVICERLRKQEHPKGWHGVPLQRLSACQLDCVKVQKSVKK